MEPCPESFQVKSRAEGTAGTGKDGHLAAVIGGHNVEGIMKFGHGFEVHGVETLRAIRAR